MYIPLDERPCNYEYPKSILAISNIEMLRPPIEILGNKKEPADVNKLLAWIKENISYVDYLIISIDMLLYGEI